MLAGSAQLGQENPCVKQRVMRNLQLTSESFWLSLILPSLRSVYSIHLPDWPVCITCPLPFSNVDSSFSLFHLLSPFLSFSLQASVIIRAYLPTDTAVFSFPCSRSLSPQKQWLMSPRFRVGWSSTHAPVLISINCVHKLPSQTLITSPHQNSSVGCLYLPLCLGFIPFDMSVLCD